MFKSCSIAGVLAAALIAAAAAPASAEVPMPAGASEATGAIAESFFVKVKNGKVADAYNGIFVGSLMAKKQAELEQVTNMTEQALRFYGAVDGWTLIKEEAATPNIVRRTYEMRTAEVPLIWRVDFYRTPKGWRVLNINFSEQLGPLFED